MNRHNSIAFIINSLEGGGAERVMCKLLSIMEPYFTQHQIHVHLVLLDALAEAHECPDYVNKITLNTEGSLVQGYRQLKPLLSSKDGRRWIQGKFGMWTAARPSILLGSSVALSCSWATLKCC